MGVVLQAGKLASGSIYQNIVGSSPYTLDDAWEAARSSGSMRTSARCRWACTRW